MSARIPTESRIFADRYFREARKIEARHAALISPGATTWRDALRALFDRMGEAGSPIKQAAVLRQAADRLNAIPMAEAMHIGFVSSALGRKRSAALVFATFAPSRHPLKGVDEDGLSVLQHALLTGRSEARLQDGNVLTYISRHAVARLHERNYRLDAGAAYSVFGALGVLGMMARHSVKHRESGMALRFGDILAVGSVKCAIQRTEDGRAADGSFLDIRTVLPVDALHADQQPLLDQGELAYDAVSEWLEERRPSRIAPLAELIPARPRRADFALQATERCA